MSRLSQIRHNRRVYRPCFSALRVTCGRVASTRDVFVRITRALVNVTAVLATASVQYWYFLRIYHKCPVSGPITEDPNPPYSTPVPRLGTDVFFYLSQGSKTTAETFSALKNGAGAMKVRMRPFPNPKATVLPKLVTVVHTS